MEIYGLGHENLQYVKSLLINYVQYNYHENERDILNEVGGLENLAAQVQSKESTTHFVSYLMYLLCSTYTSDNDFQDRELSLVRFLRFLTNNHPECFSEEEINYLLGAINHCNQYRNSEIQKLIEEAKESLIQDGSLSREDYEKGSMLGLTDEELRVLTNPSSFRKQSGNGLGWIIGIIVLTFLVILPLSKQFRPGLPEGQQNPEGWIFVGSVRGADQCILGDPLVDSSISSDVLPSNGSQIELTKRLGLHNSPAKNPAYEQSPEATTQLKVGQPMKVLDCQINRTNSTREVWLKVRLLS